MAKQALDTFVAVMKDGSERSVVKGQVLQDNHEIVQHAPSLFMEFDTGEDEADEQEEAVEEAPKRRGPGRPRKDGS